MPRHPSVPDHLGWNHLGTVTAETAVLAIVDPGIAGLFGDHWASQYIGPDGEPLEVNPDEPLEDGEVQVGDEGDLAVTAAVYSDGAYIVEGRMADVGDGAELREIRIRLWICECTCHEGEEPAEHLCEGDCHDADPD
jgi:hypothetical protein